jgi:hypothetical protein
MVDDRGMGIFGWAAAGLAGWTAVSIPLGLVAGRLLRGLSDHYPLERADAQRSGDLERVAPSPSAVRSG